MCIQKFIYRSINFVLFGKEGGRFVNKEIGAVRNFDFIEAFQKWRDKSKIHILSFFLIEIQIFSVQTSLQIMFIFENH